MIEQKQLYLHRPLEENPTYGDCFRTCMECILDIPVGSVPHFYELLWKIYVEDGDGKTNSDIALAVRNETNAWLIENGYPLQFFEVPFSFDSLDAMREYVAICYPGLYVMLGCSSVNGGHSVVIKDLDYMWDPSIDNSGCVGPMNDGHYWLGFFAHKSSNHE